MKLEEKWYEISPYLYLLLGVGVLVVLPGWVAIFCGCALVVAGLSILRMRQSYRRKSRGDASSQHG